MLRARCGVANARDADAGLWASLCFAPCIAPRLVRPSPLISMIQRTSRVLDDQRVGLHDRLAQPDGCVGNAAEGRHRIARALEA